MLLIGNAIMSSNRSSRWKKVREQAYRRDKATGAKCHICEQEIDYGRGLSGADYDPEAYEPDHILPVSLYPEFELDLSNIAAAHARCNRSRKDKAGVELRDDPSRVW